MPFHIEYSTNWDEVKGFARTSFIRQPVLTYDASGVMLPDRIIEVLSSAAMVTKSRIVLFRDYLNIKKAVYLDDMKVGFIHCYGQGSDEDFVHFRNLQGKEAVIEHTRMWWKSTMVGYEFKFEGDYEFLKSVIHLADSYEIHKVDPTQLTFELKGEILSVTFPKSAKMD